MEPAAAHVDGFDLVRARGADRLIVAVADHEVVLDDAAQRRERQVMRDHRRAISALNVEHQPIAGNRKAQRVRAVLVAERLEGVFLEQIVDRDRAFVLDIGIGAADRVFVERHLDEMALAPARRVLICG